MTLTHNKKYTVKKKNLSTQISKDKIKNNKKAI